MKEKLSRYEAVDAWLSGRGIPKDYDIEDFNNLPWRYVYVALVPDAPVRVFGSGLHWGWSGALYAAKCAAKKQLEYTHALPPIRWDEATPEQRAACERLPLYK